MRIEWEGSDPLGRWLPKRSPTGGLLAGDEELSSWGSFSFSTPLPPLPPPRAVDPDVAAALTESHREAGAPEAAMASAALLSGGARLIVTGQQTGLMGGPLLTLLKALSAIRLAEELNSRGEGPVVPLFWAEGEDHDLAEVNRVTTLDGGGHPVDLALPVPQGYGAGPAGRLPLGDGAAGVVERFFSVSGETDFSADLRRTLLADLEGAADLSRWFCRQMLGLLGGRGLLVLDSRALPFKELARPFWVRVLEDPLALTEKVRERGAALADRGFRPPLVKEKRRCAFFLFERGQRLPVFFERGSFRAGEGRHTHLELRRRLDEHPEDFSPSVHLRPLLQDYLLPTAAYVGGPSELAYFLQVLPGYGWAEITPPLLVMRASLTLVEPPVGKILRRQQINPGDLAAGIDGILGAAVRRENRLADPARWEKLRAGTRRPLERFLESLGDEEKEIAALGEKTAGKTDFQLRDLEKRAVAILRRRSETLRDQLTRSRDRLFPGGSLQERSLSPLYFMNKYGPGLVGALEKSLPRDFTRHFFGTIIP